MSKFKKDTGKDTPGISTASLPDIVFMLLFFFMVTTVMRETTIMVKQTMPEATEIKKLEKKSYDYNQSQLFIETPYRNDQLLQDLLKILDRNTEVCVACDISLPTEYIKTFTVQQWKKIKLELHKRPAIFIIHKDPLSV